MREQRQRGGWSIDGPDMWPFQTKGRITLVHHDGWRKAKSPSCVPPSSVMLARADIQTMPSSSRMSNTAIHSPAWAGQTLRWRQVQPGRQIPHPHPFTHTSPPILPHAYTSPPPPLHTHLPTNIPTHTHTNTHTHKDTQNGVAIPMQHCALCSCRRMEIIILIS